MRNFVLSLKLKKRKSVVLTLLSFVFLFSLGFNCSASFFNRYIKGDDESLSDMDIKKLSEYRSVDCANDKDQKLQVQKYFKDYCSDKHSDNNPTLLIRIEDDERHNQFYIRQITPTTKNAKKISAEEFQRRYDEYGKCGFSSGSSLLYHEPESRYGDLCPFSCEIC